MFRFFMVLSFLLIPFVCFAEAAQQSMGNTLVAVVSVIATVAALIIGYLGKFGLVNPQKAAELKGKLDAAEKMVKDGAEAIDKVVDTVEKLGLVDSAKIDEITNSVSELDLVEKAQQTEKLVQEGAKVLDDVLEVVDKIGTPNADIVGTANELSKAAGNFLSGKLKI